MDLISQLDHAVKTGELKDPATGDIVGTPKPAEVASVVVEQKPADAAAAAVVEASKPQEVKVEETPAPEAKVETPVEKPVEATPQTDDWLFGGNKEAAQAVFSDDQKKFWKEHFASQVGIDDPEAFISTHKQTSEKLSTYETKEKQWAQREQNLASVNPMLARMVQLDLSGEDFRKALDPSEGLDWTKSGKDQDPMAVINAYQKGKVTPDDVKAYKDGVADDVTKDRVEKYLEMGRDEYDRKRSDVIAQHKAHQENERQAQEKWQKSVDSAIDHSIKQYPALKSELTDPKFREGLVNGSAIESILFDEHGLLKSSAPLVMKIARDPEGFLASIQRRVQHEVKNAVALQNLKATPEAPRQNVKGDGTTPKDPNAPSDPQLAGLFQALQVAGVNTQGMRP